MKRRKTKGRSAFVWLVLAAVAIVLAFWAWQRRESVQALFTRGSPAPPVASETAQAVRQQLSGKLQVIKPPRDPNIGISAPAVALLREVSMYQWQEHCSGDDCSYAPEWSDAHIDSQKFRKAAGHENPRAPFASAPFIAGEMRIDDVEIDPALALTQHAPVDFPVAASSLPPNLAATFSVVDGALYAGGDSAHPGVGTLRIRYRIVPAGEVAVSGFRRGNRLQAR